MADKTISALTSATTPLAGTEELPIVQSSTTKKVTVANLTAGRAVSASSLSSTSKVAGKITSSGSSNRIFEVQALGGTAIAEIAYNDTNDTLRLANLSSFGNASLALYNRGSDRLEILPSGDVSCKTGNLVVSTAGKGIDFSSNAHTAGMTSELLNWYEEGTWTPTTAGSVTPGTGTYTNQVGFYTKIGRQVAVYGRVTTTAHTGSGNMLISGLPFVLKCDYAAGTINGTNLAVSANNYPVIFMTGLNSTSIFIEQIAIETGANTSVPLDVACDLIFSITYFSS